ncbi:MAG: nucleotidyltransferase domain-containing protein [Firmicutes bacterium]|nr:nucleotidyltransferase domain-containing protein [Bacillota bacterium]
MSELKNLRLEKKLTQQQMADLMGVSLRSYKSYENDEKKVGTLKYNYMMQKLSEIDPIDEEHGIVDVEYIKLKCNEVFNKYDVDFCYLFGSYAKEKAKPESDVDLLISTNVKGLKFYGMVEELRTTLHKKVDVLDVNQLNNNMELLQEILKNGIKIYG